MFLGHFALGMAAKKWEPQPSLGTYFLAVQFLDLLWPFFLIGGIEKVRIDPGNTAFTPLDFTFYPYSHSLLAAFIWSIIFGLAHYLIKRSRRSALLLSLLVLSHWLLDFITHRPDLPLGLNEGMKVGLGLWNEKWATLLLELLFFGIGAYWYMKTTKALNNTGRFVWWGLLTFLVLVYIMNVVGNPPPDAKAIGYVGLAQWLLIGWGYWVDHNRQSLKATNF